MSKKHRGKILAEVAKRHHLTITKIAKLAGYTQSTFYKHKLQSELDFDVLYKYAKILDYYFQNEFPEFSQYLEDNNLGQVENRRLSYNDLVQIIEKYKVREAEDAKTILSHLKELKDCYKELKEKQIEVESLRRELQLLK
ncbi:hypothetical protein [Pedobacter sp. BMA]|uniref:hypothetical protein n=1 Tax=Pedobacter sp. BMA TaxID=1663685 RepID=UPI0006499829|nr:hypothetical protein [Pedobacter sp. BMA]KLT67109.1 hypothetical protein AB669_04260 [Pedobacter sp. BMA]